MGRRGLLGTVRETGGLPWAALSRTGRLSIAGVAASAALAIALGIAIPRIAESQSIDARAEAAHSLVHSLRSSDLIPTIDEPLSGAEYHAFDRMVRDGLLGGENVRVKLWNRSGQVVYSDEPREIGRQYPMEQELASALAGTTAAHVSDMSREENEFDASIGAPLLEIYVPVHDGPRVFGAFEIYQRFEPLAAHLARLRTAVWIAVGSGLSILLVFLILLFAATGRSMAREHRETVEQAEDLSLLLETSRLLSGEPSLDGAGREVLAAVTAHLRLRCAALWVGDPTPLMSFSSHQEDLCPTLVSAAQSALAEHPLPVSGWVEASFVRSEGTDCAVLAVAFPVGTDATGVLAGCGQRVFGERERLLVTGVAHQLSVAVESARRFEGLREMTEERGRLLRRQVEAQEKERRHLVGDLHDGLGQALTRILFGLRGSRARLTGQPEVAEELGRLEDLAEEQSRSIRRFMARIRPAVLEDFGLPAALEALAREHEAEWAVPIDVQVEASPELDPAVGVTLYRAAQEAVMNARKYARPNRVWIGLSQSDGRVVLTVHDDGTGNDHLHEGTGLSHLRDRVTSLGGTVEVRSSRKGGTTLTATLPFETGGTDGADPGRR
ncbi:MAG TPA: sensor histidine kinase [Actinomycetota bacterium]